METSLTSVPSCKGISKINRKRTYLRKVKHNSKRVEFNRKLALCSSSFEPDGMIKEKTPEPGLG